MRRRSRASPPFLSPRSKLQQLSHAANHSSLFPPSSVLGMLRSFLIAATTAPCIANPDPLAPLSAPDLCLLVNHLHSHSLVIKSRVRSCILSHLPAFSATFSAAARSISAADAVTDADTLLGLLSPGAPPPPTSPSAPRPTSTLHFAHVVECNLLCKIVGKNLFGRHGDKLSQSTRKQSVNPA